MTTTLETPPRLEEWVSHLRTAQQTYPCAAGRPVMSQAPAVVDVMGGICEEGGSLVVTSTLGLRVRVALWQTGGRDVLFRYRTDGARPSEFTLPIDTLGGSKTTAEAVLERCRDGLSGWVAPAALAIHKSFQDGALPRFSSGLAVVLWSDFPADADLGRATVTAAAVVDALARLGDVKLERLRKATLVAQAVAPLVCVRCLRTAITALAGPAGGSVLQLRFHPQMTCEPLALPPGIVVEAATTRLARPVTLQRLVETELCAEMGRRVIVDLQQKDGVPQERTATRLAVISPTDYVERYRDRIPLKITGKAFMASFGTLRDLNGEIESNGTYKIRSRAEHHIYENRRVHEFVERIARASRSGSVDDLLEAGELMYASHWSHSQRCGIGGVETDRLVSLIRQRGAAAGLFGAKVTGGGNGGEVVVLMRDDAAAHAALQSAIAAVERQYAQKIRTYRGAIRGAEFFEQPPTHDCAAVR